LAEAAEDVDTRDRRMSDDEVSPVFIGVLLLHSDEIDGIIIACFLSLFLIWMDSIPRC
jgi:hypothetical protein